MATLIARVEEIRNTQPGHYKFYRTFALESQAGQPAGTIRNYGRIGNMGSVAYSADMDRFRAMSLLKGKLAKGYVPAESLVVDTGLSDTFDAVAIDSRKKSVVRDYLHQALPILQSFNAPPAAIAAAQDEESVLEVLRAFHQRTFDLTVELRREGFSLDRARAFKDIAVAWEGMKQLHTETAEAMHVLTAAFSMAMDQA